MARVKRPADQCPRPIKSASPDRDGNAVVDCTICSFGRQQGHVCAYREIMKGRKKR